ncbi:MAG TPA: cysteine--tRNA ligase [Xanthobacteraceae bacterium]|nr:cysteine--tRNA ligase [Xanthobacteraceae bacterium]
MELKLYDTLTREKRPFTPIDPNNVRMYVCGPTVYDYAHIGNARPVIVFDVLFRLLRHIYGEQHVTYVRNITDVDDKINARAAERGIPIRQLTEETYNNFKVDVAALGCLPPSYEPRATEYISNASASTDMIQLIEKLIANGNAYAEQGHVLFSVGTMPDYGKLSKRSLDEMIAGARVEVAPYKRDAMDFVLWKPSPPELPGWDSPWGRGRPGWHIECSAMSAALLGETFDIHGGGIDLVFPHHENEIAQSRCAFHNGAMANYWLHNGFLQVEGEKMAKSAGNFVTINELLRDWPGDVLRLAMLGSHYRQPINWTLKSLNEAEKALAGWFEAAADQADPRPAPAVVEALLDDLNTPKAIAEMHALRNRAGHKSLAGTMAFFGLRGGEFEEWQQRRAPSLQISEADIAERIAQRLEARKAKNFAESDRIRDELAALGVVLKDSKEGTTWEIAR